MYQPTEEFLKQTAKDYCMSLDKVKQIANSTTSEEFYDRLEEELELRRHSN